MKVSRQQSSGITRTVNDLDPGDVYAITGGTYLGEFFVYIEKTGKDYFFLSLPDMEIRSIPYDKCKTGLENRLMDLVEILPDDVHEVCLAQYRKAKNS